MKKYGFTLAEILIVLGLIGIVAALTTPTLIANIRNNANATRLSATVSTLENAFTTMLAKEDVDSENLLFDTDAWREFGGDKAGFAGAIGNYMQLEGFREFSSSNDIKNYYGEGKGPFILNQNGSKNPAVNDRLARYFIETNNNLANANHSLILKNGAIVFLIINNQDGQKTDEEEEAILAAGGGITSIAADIWIDVNGAAAPNTMGKDIFGFYLGKNGKLYPLGGRSVAVYESIPPQLLWNSAGSWNCQNGNISGGGYGCTARVVEEGYKINY